MGCLSKLGEKPIWWWAPAAPLRAIARTGDEEERSRREMMDVVVSSCGGSEWL